MMMRQDKKKKRMLYTHFVCCLFFLQVQMTVKYDEQCRLGAGVCIKKVDEKEVGLRLPLFDYTGKELVGIGKEKTLIENEIRRVRGLPDNCRGGWVTRVRREGCVYEEDPIDILEGLGKRTKEAMSKMGFRNVKAVRSMTDEDICSIIQDNNKQCNRLTMSNLRKWRTASATALPGSCDSNTDYRSEANPYLARYGEKEWERMIWVVSPLSTKYASIKQLVRHMDKETAKVYRGTEFESSYKWYHDALTQLTEKDCVSWMQREGFYKNWIRPILGCNDVICAKNKDGVLKNNTRYRGRPVGNSPEGHPLDNSCFRDSRVNLALHVAATWNLQDGDLKKFSLVTPREISRAMMRLWDPEEGVAPKSERIIHDVKGVVQACLKIVEYGGGIVPGLANRTGHRKIKIEEAERDSPKKKFRNLKTLTEMGIHKSIHDVVIAQFLKEKQRFFGNLEHNQKQANLLVEYSTEKEN